LLIGVSLSACEDALVKSAFSKQFLVQLAAILKSTINNQQLRDPQGFDPKFTGPR
jgi:hypothetical protein